MMQTKHCATDFLAAMFPAFVIAVGMLAMGQLPPPYSLIGAVLYMVLLALFTPWSRWSVLPRLLERRSRARDRSHAHAGS